MDNTKIYQAIYDDVFYNTYRQSCYVFLCGGAGREHIRNKVRDNLKQRNLQILYPEDLFMEMLNRNKKSDLLEYENFLAENADIICVICESMGSAVELGAFVQNEEIRHKMVVAVNQKFARDKSFIMMGPVRHIQKENAAQVVTYKENALDDLARTLARRFISLTSKRDSAKDESFHQLSAYIAFIPLVIYFYQRIPRGELFHDMKNFLRQRGQLPPRYKELFNVAIKYLQKTGILVTEFENHSPKDSDKREWNSTLSLSSKGYAETHALLSGSAAAYKTILHDRIRCAILKKQLHN